MFNCPAKTHDSTHHFFVGVSEGSEEEKNTAYFDKFVSLFSLHLDPHCILILVASRSTLHLDPH